MGLKNSTSQGYSLSSTIGQLPLIRVTVNAYFRLMSFPCASPIIAYRSVLDNTQFQTLVSASGLQIKVLRFRYDGLTLSSYLSVPTILALLADFLLSGKVRLQAARIKPFTDSVRLSMAGFLPFGLARYLPCAVSSLRPGVLSAYTSAVVYRLTLFPSKLLLFRTC